MGTTVSGISAYQISLMIIAIIAFFKRAVATSQVIVAQLQEETVKA